MFVLVQLFGALRDTYVSYSYDSYEKLMNLCKTVSWNSTTLLDVEKNSVAKHRHFEGAFLAAGKAGEI